MAMGIRVSLTVMIARRIFIQMQPTRRAMVSMKTGWGDESPYNVVRILHESHRALNVGHLKDFSAASNSPFLDELSQRTDARVFTRHQVNGVTISVFLYSLFSLCERGYGC